MAEITPTKQKIDRRTIIFTWSGMNGGDTGLPVDVPGFADKSIQAEGTFNSLTLTIQGTNDDSNYETLNDPNGNALTMTAGRIEQVLENIWKIRPSVSAGSGASIDVSMIMSTRGEDRSQI